DLDNAAVVVMRDQHPIYDAVVQFPPQSKLVRRWRNKLLRDQEYLPGIRIFHFGSGGKAFYIDVLAWRKWAFDEILFARNWNSVGKVTFGNFARSGSGRGGSDWRFFPAGVLRLNWAIRIKWLLLRRV